MLEVRESNSLDIRDRQVVNVDHVVLYELVEHIFVDCRLAPTSLPLVVDGEAWGEGRKWWKDL